MTRAPVLIAAFVAGAAAALLALYVALSTAPGVIMADDMVAALTVVADGSLSRFPGDSVVYVKSPIGAALIDKLQATHPSLKLMSFSARPEDNGCLANGSSIPGVPCQRDDFIKLEALSSPTQRTMLVAFGTSRTFGQVLLLKFWGRWRVLLSRSYTV
jgi:hypothetical protein